MVAQFVDKASNINMTFVVEQSSSYSPKGHGILAFAYTCVAFVVLVLPESVIVKPASFFCILVTLLAIYNKVVMRSKLKHRN